MTDAIFDESIDRVKARAFDVVAEELKKVQAENFRLGEMVNAWLEDCHLCEGSGMRKYNAVYVNGDLYQDAEVLECDECKGTGKIPK